LRRELAGVAEKGSRRGDHTAKHRSGGSGGEPDELDPVTLAVLRLIDQYRRIAGASFRTVAALPDALVALAESSEKIVTTLPDALVALAEVSERMAILARQMERVNDTIDRAASRVDQAAEGMRRASSGIREVVEMLGTSIPNLGSLDYRLDHLDTVISELSSTMFSFISAVPLLRRAVRLPTGTKPRAIPPPRDRSS
jgi:methyl-accepting chemotaxis protein